MTKMFERQELALMISAALGGSITFQVLAGAMKDCDPRIVSRVLSNLEAAGALKRFRVVGGHGLEVWLTTQALQKGEKPGIKTFTTQGDLCMPPKEWWHDQLAARYTLLFADSVDEALLEFEIKRWDQSGLPRLADGVFRHTCPDSQLVTIGATEVETSRKTGLNGGWAKLAVSMIDRSNGSGEIVPCWGKRVDASVVIAPWSYMKAIRAMTRRILERRWKRGHDDPIRMSVLGGAWWLWLDLDKPNSSPLLMTAVDDGTRESNWLGYRAVQQKRTKDPVRRECAIRAHQERKAAMLRTMIGGKKSG